MEPEACIRSNISRLEEAICAAALRAGRDRHEISFVAATKYVDAPILRLLYRAGVRDFAENTVQRGISKHAALEDLEDVRWHMIGHLQRNKVSKALRIFQEIHSVDSPRLLEEIVSQARAIGSPLPRLYVEVNVASEERKTGLRVEDVPALLRLARDRGAIPSSRDSVRPALSSGIVGLMAMAPDSENPEEVRPHFRRLRELRDSLVADGLLAAGSGLSMGMSGDFAIAVEEGATILRVGSLLFEGLDSR